MPPKNINIPQPRPPVKVLPQKQASNAAYDITKDQVSFSTHIFIKMEQAPVTNHTFGVQWEDTQKTQHC